MAVPQALTLLPGPSPSSHCYSILTPTHKTTSTFTAMPPTPWPGGIWGVGTHHQALLGGIWCSRQRWLGMIFSEAWASPMWPHVSQQAGSPGICSWFHPQGLPWEGYWAPHASRVAGGGGWGQPAGMAPPDLSSCFTSLSQQSIKTRLKHSLVATSHIV